MSMAFAFTMPPGAAMLSLCSWTERLLWPSVALVSVGLAAMMSSVPIFCAVATSALRNESAAVGIAITTGCQWVIDGGALSACR